MQAASLRRGIKRSHSICCLQHKGADHRDEHACVVVQLAARFHSLKLHTVVHCEYPVSTVTIAAAIPATIPAALLHLFPHPCS